MFILMSHLTVTNHYSTFGCFVFCFNHIYECDDGLNTMCLAVVSGHDVVSHHHWSWGTQLWVPLALQLCHSSNKFSPRCLLGLMPITQWVLLRWCYSSSCLQPFQQYVGTCNFGGLPSITWWGGVFPSGFVLANDLVNSNSVVGIKHGDISVVIGYQVDEFTCTWLAEHFVAESHIYPGFTDNVSTQTLLS